MVNFHQIKSIFSKTAGLIELKIGVQMRETILETWILKKGGPYEIHFFKEKCQVPPHSKENNKNRKALVCNKHTQRVIFERFHKC